MAIMFFYTNNAFLYYTYKWVFYDKSLSYLPTINLFYQIFKDEKYLFLDNSRMLFNEVGRVLRINFVFIMPEIERYSPRLFPSRIAKIKFSRCYLLISVYFYFFLEFICRVHLLQKLSNFFFCGGRKYLIEFIFFQSFYNIFCQAFAMGYRE